MKKIILILLSLQFYSLYATELNCNIQSDKIAYTGESVTLTTRSPTNDTNETFTHIWYKDNVPLSNNSDILNISNLSLYDNGFYHCKLTGTNTNQTNIQCFNLIVNEAGSNSIVNDYALEEFVLWYDESKTEADRNEVRTSLYNLGASLQKSCLCDLELWAINPSNLTQLEIEDETDVARQEVDEDESEHNYIIEAPVPQYCIANFQLRWDPLDDLTTSLRSPKIAIMDTGFETNNSAYSSLVWNQETAAASCCTTGDLSGYNAANTCRSITDQHGHGTAVAGIVGQFSPSNTSAEIMNIQIINNQGGDIFNLICGGNFAIDNGADIINMSFGYYGNKSPLVERFIQKAKENNVLLVTSAGNSGQGLNNHWPSGFSRYPNYDHIISVGAVDGDGNPMIFSSTADIYAPGHNLIVPGLNGTEALKSGTSFSTAFVTSAAAALLEESDLSPSQLISNLRGENWSKSGAGINSHHRLLLVELIPVTSNDDPIIYEDYLTLTSPIMKVEDFDAAIEITASSSITPQTTVNFRAGQRIVLTPGFHASKTAMVHGKIESCHYTTSQLGRMDQATQLAEINGSSSFTTQPNPFTIETTLGFALEEKANIHLAVYNVLGQEIEVLADAYKEAGDYSYRFSGETLPAGIYYAILDRAGEKSTKKLILVK